MASLESTLTHMDIFLGDACNLRCVHCQCWINDRAPLFGAQVLEARLFEAIEYVATQCPQFEKVMLIGGEPFVHEGVPRFLQKQRIDTEITVYTNFVWPDPDITLPDNVFFLSSLDAAQQDVYGQLRRTKDFAYSQENMRRHADRLISRRHHGVEGERPPSRRHTRHHARPRASTARTGSCRSTRGWSATPIT